jgi:hypothetical protein
MTDDPTPDLNAAKAHLDQKILSWVDAIEISTDQT